MIHSWAQSDGTQKIVDTGPFGTERQRRWTESFWLKSKRFISDAVKADKPFFVWHNTTRMHYRTNLSKKYEGRTGYGLYADGMAELDDNVGELLQSPRRPERRRQHHRGVHDRQWRRINSWPDGGNTPFAGEKGAGAKEGGFRVPMVVRWPGKIAPGATTGEFMTMEDWLPTLMAAVGQAGIKEKLLGDYKAGDNAYQRIHLDGYDQTGLLTGKGPICAQGVLLLHRNEAARGALRRLEIPVRQTGQMVQWRDSKTW